LERASRSSVQHGIQIARGHTTRFIVTESVEQLVLH
jgi:hypothetical protein